MFIIGDYSQPYGRKEKTVKRSIRIPLRVHEVLSEESVKRGKSVNQVILEDLGRMYGIEVGERRRGRRWY